LTTEVNTKIYYSSKLFPKT